MSYFDKILIANRGEIARRIIRTCKHVGIRTVAVYSEADVDAPFVEEADEAVCIGPAQAKKSYLDIERVIQVAKETEAKAIHPGYGFLSENPVFVRRCEEEGIVFIGPSARIIELMGSKIEARRQMQAAGVPVVPGWDGKLASVEEALFIAESLGYPLMLKASAGGGGIGMQLVHTPDELQKAFDSTMQRAASYFGDGTLFLEKWISNPRHIEVQVACDAQGNAVHLFERECSVQRRNQKVIEESPSPYLDENTRAELLETALRGVKQIGYVTVGTMEFIFDDKKNFYFLEMNTRLQVEHPVTEEITGLDLVEWQIRLAAGEPLPLQQENIKRNGHAMECRLYAEDPQTFFPSPGTLTRLHIPENDVRLDFAVIEGSVVTPFYDPMIGKIITHGHDRADAIRKMEKVLETCRVEGVKTNTPLLQKVMRDEEFRKGQYTTRFLDKLLV
ncbi:acetyl-CoA carboxylase biotin carboxylase subunit [Aneurinibacillus migulanus]|uniref:biotin carboxylase n=1 Tax=Aneurinibacillus migulanus TaxID=47500 RepID=A0A0D1Y0T0_ANEMI|nr:acetyl-CoA carboxylase biotin carboxylase subunit [Aneurinibacillus migulanus]KIV57933.1 biotin carboxylase [Aneurinibacillus migulanus]KON97303.1 biotin carboxylase [Aneurinibacillus migulanus]MED0894028.1 acetyl-CoA carboxylase biotin carboxylase subunit [Aneurinibacillus migulanus]MED1616793.1 acetyl-CoA carboxylase biotin carboxylase subunit [Aneurinibacillus migulanus]SDJ02582.1 acetyl-CoA carboxylase, biotin carboxylase subunit [Aneurinibacillus migulanus]